MITKIDFNISSVESIDLTMDFMRILPLDSHYLLIQDGVQTLTVRRSNLAQG